MDDDETRWTDRRRQGRWAGRPGNRFASDRPRFGNESAIAATQGSLRSPKNQIAAVTSSIDRTASLPRLV